jgi:phosphoesterase RecJ-like protein
MEQQLKVYIENSEKILITSHLSPDPDALASALLLGEILESNYPDKRVLVVLEEKPNKDLSFLKGYENIQFADLAETVKTEAPNLFIMTDVNTIDRVCRKKSDELKQWLKDNHNNCTTVVIDHHEEDGRDTVDLFINRGSPAATQDVYQIFFKDLSLQKPPGYEKTAMLGILTDTHRFKYANPKYHETFEIVSQLIEAGANIEALENQLERYSQLQILVFGQLASNLVLSEKGYSWSYIKDDFTNTWLSSNKSQDDFKSGCELFVNQYIRNIEDNKWGFIVFPDLAAGHSFYSVSFRAVSEAKNVADLARQLGGGGHKPAAGAKIQAARVEEVIEKVKNLIEG